MATTTQTAPRDNGLTLDTFNDALRASPGWQAFMQRNGAVPGRPIKLSDAQRQALKRELEAAGMVFPRGMEIDPAGNINQDQGVSRYWANPYIRAALFSGAALATMGAAGFGPLAGVLGGGGGSAAAGTAAGVLPSSSLTGSTFAAAAGMPAGTAAGMGVGTAAGVGGGLGSTALRYGLQYGAPIAGQAIGSWLQSRAMNDASEREADYLNRALADAKEEREYNRAQRADYLKRLEPYAAVGPSALNRLTSAHGQAPSMARAAQMPGSAAPVRMIAPDGSVSQVPAHLAEWYRSRGATVEGSAGMSDNDRRRMASAAEGYGWGGRRPGQPKPTIERA